MRCRAMSAAWRPSGSASAVSRVHWLNAPIAGPHQICQSDERRWSPAVAVPLRVRQPLEREHSEALTEERPVGRGVERPHAPAG